MSTIPTVLPRINSAAIHKFESYLAFCERVETEETEMNAAKDSRFCEDSHMMMRNIMNDEGLVHIKAIGKQRQKENTKML
ncbi:hypothetical protein RYX36_020787 [Vicia faba]